MKTIMKQFFRYVNTFLGFCLKKPYFNSVLAGLHKNLFILLCKQLMLTIYVNHQLMLSMTDPFPLRHNESMSQDQNSRKVFSA